MLVNRFALLIFLCYINSIDFDGRVLDKDGVVWDQLIKIVTMF